jgi:GNAT superfamily N-acetyltransferase
MDQSYQLRLATPDDVPALHDLIARSVRGLSAGFYTPTQIESALRYVFGPDTQLVADGTYYVVEADGEIVAAGGWSRRRTMYGGDQSKQGDDPLLDPAVDAARIRAFFVHPGRARRGLGRRLFEACRTAAGAAGFRRLELVATMPGEPLYRTLDFEVAERFTVTFPDGVEVPFALMTRPVELPGSSPA